MSDEKNKNVIIKVESGQILGAILVVVGAAMGYLGIGSYEWVLGVGLFIAIMTS